MKKYSPYIFPLIVVLIVLFLLFRWYQTRSEQTSKKLDFSEGVEIENLSESEADSILRGVGDYETVALEQEPDTATPAAGVVRYEIVDDKVKFSVTVNAEEPKDGPLTVWLRNPETGSLRQAFDLELGKAGLIGTGALSADLLPFEVVVSPAQSEDDVLESVVLRGTINEKSESSEE